jgi:hypothetical protein
MNKLNKELHLMIIWQNARYKEKEIIASLSKKFTILEKYEIEWNKSLFEKNLSNFYGTKLPKNSKKEIHCGNGKFLLITFYDNYPKYSLVETGRGTEEVNLNVFLIKEKFRNMTGGGHKVHTTNTIAETNHDLVMLFGINYSDYEILISKKENTTSYTNNIIENVPSNIVGVDGWKNLEQLLYVMNNTLEYVVLRNFETLPEQDYSNDHFDIDYLVKDLNQAVFITNAIKVNKRKDSVHYKIKIADRYIFVDFRYISDNYYDENWQHQMLINKIYSENGYYRLSDEDYFYSLIYHVFIHKLSIQDDYFSKLKNIFKRLKNYNEKICTFDNFLILLEKYLELKRYRYTQPNDSSVFFDKKFINYKIFISTLVVNKIKNIYPFFVKEWKNFSQYIYFSGNTEDDEELIIKYGGIGESAKREYKILEILRKLDSKFFPKPYYFRSNFSEKFVAIEKINGDRLDKLIASNVLKSKSNQYQLNLYRGIYQILKILHESKIVHRDIRPENLIIKSNGLPILIDFQFSVDVKRKYFKEFKIIRKKPRLIKNLGSYYAKNKSHWDDAHSVIKILDQLNLTSNSEFTEIRNKTNSLIGKYEIISVYNNIFCKIVVLIKNFLPRSLFIHSHLIFYKLLYLLSFNEKMLSKINKYKKKIFENKLHNS